MIQKLKRSLLCVLLLGIPSISSAEVITYQADFIVTSVVDTDDMPSTDLEPSIQINDTFRFTFTLDDSDLDTASDTTTGIFENSLSLMSLVRLGGLGTWNPSTGTFDSFLAVVTSNAATDAIQFAPGSNFDFPQAEAEDLTSLRIRLEDSTGVAVDDTGLGQTLRNQLGGSNFDPNDFPDNNTVRLFFSNDLTVNASLTSFTPVPIPEPSTFLLLGISGVSAIWLKRRKQAAVVSAE